jgi:hypothetical protein
MAKLKKKGKKTLTQISNNTTTQKKNTMKTYIAQKTKPTKTNK